MGTFCCSSRDHVFLAIFVFLLIPFSRSENFKISRFSPYKNDLILLEGEADAKNFEGVIELNRGEFICSVGRVVYNAKVPIWDSKSRKAADFTTHFSFTIDMQNLAEHGDGFAFFLAPVGFEIPPHSAGKYLGLFKSAAADSTPGLVMVEFDTVPNPDLKDPPYEHVAINTNSIVSLKTEPWNATAHNGALADAWITYNATTTNLSVFWGYNGGPNSSLHYPIDLKEVLPPWVTIGFSASTGIWKEKHILRSWEFSSSLDIKEDKIGLVVGLTASGCILIACVVVAYVAWRKRRESIWQRNNPEADNLISINDDLEREAGPRRFSYEELALATNFFSDKRKLGEGGFGGVYKGHLVDLDLPIAVKKFSRGSKQGKKQYITEVKVISTLRHRNLVRLIGWCHDLSHLRKNNKGTKV